MITDRCRDALELVEMIRSYNTGSDYLSPWSALIPGMGGYNGTDWVMFSGTLVINGESIEHVARLDARFDEGAELINIIVKFRDGLFKVSLENNSWVDETSGYEFLGLWPVEERQVTRTEYVRV